MGERAKYTVSRDVSMVNSRSVIGKQKRPRATSSRPLIGVGAQRASVPFDVGAQGPQAVLNVSMPAVELVEIVDFGLALSG